TFSMSGDRTSAHSTGGNFNYALCTRAGFAGRSARQAARATVTIMGALLALATFPDVATAQRAADSFAGVQAVPAGIRTLSEVHPHYFSRMGDPGAPSVPAIAGQVALGTLATPVGYVGGGLATRWIATRLGVSDDAARRAAYVGAYAVSTLATAATVEYLGRTGRVAGSFPATIGGTVAG